jgi:hypothetical protein
MISTGCAVIFLWAFSPSPIEVGHIKAIVKSAAFDLTVATTLRDSSCESNGGFSTGFLEKSITELWSKYVIIVL